MGLKTTAPVAVELTWDQVHAFRLAGHHLVRQASKSKMIEVVGAIGGAQAQVMSAAEMQIVTRAVCTSQDVRDALWQDRTLVKTWLMRGTLHLVPARDLPVYTAAIGAVSMVPRASWFKYFGFTQPELARLVDTIAGALSSRPMTREEVIAVAGQGQSDRVRTWLKSGWGGFLKPVARMGLLCFGPSRGTNVTFVNPREWLGGWRDIDRDVAIAELARRYLRAFGPATRQDFAFWLGRWPGVGQAAWRALENELVTVSVEGWRAQMLASDLDRLPRASKQAVRLLGPFDPYLMGWSSRAHLFDGVHRSKVTRTAGWISAVLLVGGRVEGTWTHRVGKGEMQIDLLPFRRLSRDEVAEARTRAGELAQSLGASRARLTVIPATTPARPASRA